MQIKITRGLNLTFKGAPRQVLRQGAAVQSVALLGEDLPQLRPTFKVQEGDRVGAGQLLFTDRKHAELAFVAPVAGIVQSISRGARRSLDALILTTEGTEAVDFGVPGTLTRDSLVPLLLQSGSWPAFRARPFGRIPAPGASPAAIFVMAIDTAPLAADPAVVIAAYPEWFRRGAAALTHLTEGKTYLCRAAGAPIDNVDGLETVDIAGPHPAGLPSSAIHHLHPVGEGESVWHIGYQDVIAIGHLLETGRIWTDRIVALAGPALTEPGLVVTRPGANLRELAKGLVSNAGAQLLSGSPLDGRVAHFLGRYHVQATAIQHHMPASGGNGWLHRLRTLAREGAPALIPNGAHERVAPLHVLPVPLLRALGIGDLETARRLGALELVEEDLALLSHVDGGDTDYGALLRAVLDELEAAQ